MKKLLLTIPAVFCLFACKEKEAEPDKMSATELSSEINKTLDNLKNSEVIHMSMTMNFMMMNYNIDSYIDYQGKSAYMVMEYNSFYDVDEDGTEDSCFIKHETISKVSDGVSYVYTCETTTYENKPSYNLKDETLEINTYDETNEQIIASEPVSITDENLDGYNYTAYKQDETTKITIELSSINFNDLTESATVPSDIIDTEMLSAFNFSGNLNIEINSDNIKFNTENVNVSAALQSGETVGSPTVSMPINLSLVVEGSTDKSKFNIPEVSEENTIDFRE